MQAQWDPLISGIEFVQRGPVTPAVKTRTGSSCFLESSPLGMHSICCHVTGPGKEIDPESSLYSFSLPSSSFPVPLQTWVTGWRTSPFFPLSSFYSLHIQFHQEAPISGVYKQLGFFWRIGTIKQTCILLWAVHVYILGLKGFFECSSLGRRTQRFTFLSCI